MTTPAADREWIKFRHARFTARFPADFLYSPSHYWMMPVPGDPGLWRVGFTKFATRMLGELVDFTFNPPEGGPVQPGEMIGWVEGFKAAVQWRDSGKPIPEGQEARDLVTELEKRLQGG